MDRDRTNGQRLTAEDMGGDATPYVEALVQLANERQRYTPGVYGPRREPLPEKEAVARAVEAVREVRRRELWGDREPEGSERSFEDVENWERSREDRGVSGRGTSTVECPARRHRHERADSGPDHHGRGCRKPRVVQAAGTGAIRLALSDELLKEAVEVVRRKDRQGQIVSASLALEAAMDLWSHGFMYHPFRLDWPSISDREDYWVLDLAWEAKVDYIISVDPHLSKAKLSMPIEVLEPSQLIRRLDL